MSYYFPSAWNRYPRHRTPFMHELYEDMKKRKPYTGLKIIHNMPIMISDLIKIDCLMMSGADVTITMPKFARSDSEAIDLVKKSIIKFIPEHNFSEQYDIFLDCCGELADVFRPLIGAVEITQTGANKYRQMKIDYPMISIDDSQLKYLEDSSGSADGFIRALYKLIKEDLRYQKYIIFGFGKVGVGIAKELKKLTNNVIVVDKLQSVLKNAEKLGYQTINAQEKELVERCVQDAFCIVTATGNKGFISREYDVNHFRNKYLVNIGAEDEFGEKFSANEVLNEKMPVNFVLKEPTKIEYLDPAYYAHNTCIDLVLNKNLSNGVHPLPKDMDNNILKKWFDFHHEDQEKFFFGFEQHYNDVGDHL